VVAVGKSPQFKVFPENSTNFFQIRFGKIYEANPSGQRVEGHAISSLAGETQSFSFGEGKRLLPPVCMQEPPATPSSMLACMHSCCPVPTSYVSRCGLDDPRCCVMHTLACISPHAATRNPLPPQLRENMDIAQLAYMHMHAVVAMPLHILLGSTATAATRSLPPADHHLPLHHHPPHRPDPARHPQQRHLHQDAARPCSCARLHPGLPHRQQPGQLQPELAERLIRHSDPVPWHPQHHASAVRHRVQHHRAR
jgi:hypothetical protein